MITEILVFCDHSNVSPPPNTSGDNNDGGGNGSGNSAETEIAYLLKRKECIEISLANPEITAMMSSITMPCDDDEDKLEDMVVKFCEVHECNDSSNDSKMDTHNNAVGHQIGQNFMDAPIEVLVNKVCDKLAAGQLKILEGGTGGPDGDPNSAII